MGIIQIQKLKKSKPGISDFKMSKNQLEILLLCLQIFKINWA
jgi:hypothetical protein